MIEDPKEKYSEEGILILNKLNRIFLEFDPAENPDEYKKDCIEQFKDIEKGKNVEEIRNDLYRRCFFKQINTWDAPKFNMKPVKEEIISLLINGELVITDYGRAFSDLNAQTDFLMGYFETQMGDKFDDYEKKLEKSNELLTIAIKQVHGQVKDIEKGVENIKVDMKNTKDDMRNATKTIQSKIYSQIITIMGIFVAVIAFVITSITPSKIKIHQEYPIFSWSLWDRFWMTLIDYSPIIIAMAILFLIWQIQFSRKK